MKKFLFMPICVAVVALFVMTSCEDPELDIPVESITIDQSTGTDFKLGVGKSQVMTVTFTPADATDQAVMWTSSNDVVASFKENTVTAHEVGTATLTATASNGITAMVDIEVLAEGVIITNPASEEFLLKEGTTEELTAEVISADEVAPTVTWTSSEPTVASIEGSTLTAIMQGKTMIIATSNGLSDTVYLEVYPLSGYVDKEGTWEIYNADGLGAFRDAVNGENGTAQPTLNAKLMADIDLIDDNWEPIGTSSYVTFEGYFDGNYKTIRGLKITGETDSQGGIGENNYRGLIGYMKGEISDVGAVVTKRTTISNLTIEAPAITGYRYVSAVVAYAKGVDIDNCDVEGGSVEANHYFGGIVGSGESIDITGCSNSAEIKSVSTESDISQIGGICGSIDIGEIVSCENSGAVTATEVIRVGGIVGYTTGTVLISNCTNSASATITSKGSVGGIVGDGGNTKITGCKNEAEIKSLETSNIANAGGICGFIGGGEIESCENSGAVTATDAARVGGIVGSGATASILSSKNSAAITGTNAVGGIVGGYSSMTVFFCENSGDVEGTEEDDFNNAAGIVGGAYNNTSPVAVYSCVNSGTVSGKTNVGGIIALTPSITYIGASYNTGVITAAGQALGHAGGLVANYSSSTSVMYGLYSTGGVSATLQAGGIVGKLSSSSPIDYTYWIKASDDNTATDAIGLNDLSSSSSFNITSDKSLAELNGTDVIADLNEGVAAFIEAYNSAVDAGRFSNKIDASMTVIFAPSSNPSVDPPVLVLPTEN